MTPEQIIPHDEALRMGLLRIVGKQRARKLRRRGEIVQWSSELNSRVWLPAFPFKARLHLGRDDWTQDFFCIFPTGEDTPA